MTSTGLLRASGVSLILGGAAIALFVLLLYPVGGFFGAEHAHHPLWAPAHFLHFVGAICTLLGLVGLYVRQAEQAGKFGLVSFVVAFVGTALFVGTGMLTAFVWPLLADQAPGSLEPNGALFLPPSGVLFVLTISSLILGYAMFAVTTIRAGVLPGGGALLLAVGTLLSITPPEPVSPLPWIGLVLGGVLFGAGAIWLGWALFATEPARVVTRPAVETGR